MSEFPLRVVIVNDASQARGGATGLALLQAEMLRARGIDTTFFAADQLDNDRLGEIGATHINVGSRPLMKSHPLIAASQGLYNKAVLERLSRFIAEHDTPGTVYHVHSWSKALTTSAFAALRKVAPRVFIHVHDFFVACPNGGFMDYQAMRPCTRVPLSSSCLLTHCDKRNYPQKLWRVSRQALLRTTLPRRAPWGGFLLIHPAMAPFLEASGYPAERLHALRNPAAAFVAERVRAERNAGFLFIGRVEAEKGIEDLITAATSAGVPLSVIGEGPLLDPLKAAHPEVRFLGWMGRAEIAEEARCARAVVMPSRYPEPFGLVAAEAVLSGLPVILSDTALLAQEIQAQGLGFACDTRDGAVFSALLRQVAEMPQEEIAEMSARGASGSSDICTTPEAWIDAQIDHFRRVTTGSVL